MVGAHDLICTICWTRAQETISLSAVTNVGRNCVLCNRILEPRTRSHQLTSLKTNSQHHLNIRNIIVERLAPLEIRSSHYICHPCWQRADRAAINYSTASTSRDSSGSMTAMPLRCANCDIILIRERRHILDNDSILMQVQQQVTQRMVTANDYICGSCHTLFMNRDPVPSSQHSQDIIIRGHEHVCLRCGYSVARIRSHYIEEESNQSIVEVVRNWIHPREEHPTRLVRRCLAIILLPLILKSVNGQCPWEGAPELQAACVCAYNLARDLSVQCDQVDFTALLTTINSSARSTAIDLLYINNSTIPVLRNDMFSNLKIHNLQISGCKIRKIEDNAFRGQGPYVKNLNLQDNELAEVPVKALKILINLSLLDISKNHLTSIENHSFITLRKLTTLKLSDNNITLATHALSGLESSLKNLNLKGTRQKSVPECIRGLGSLAFLDLSQNSIRELPGPDGTRTFEGLDSLTALNLERNLIVNLREDAFEGIKTSLSSLSLLNNLLPEFPSAAIGTLNDLRVLDIGFNLLNKLPVNAFSRNTAITLLALDGNPLPTVPVGAFTHLNQTLRGLSLGGRFLNCDCRLRWIIEWIRNGELQVTSRERNPQFCGNPPHFRERGFYSFEPNELICEHETTVVPEKTQTSKKDNDDWKTSPTTISSTSTSKDTPKSSTIIVPVSSTSSANEAITKNIPSTTTTTTRPSRIPSVRPAAPTWRHAPNQRPPLVMNFPQQKPKIDDSNEVIVKNAYRQDNSVIIQWDSDVANILGFRVVYRLFGDKSFKQGPPLEASEREFKIKNVPSQECIVVCVISLEEVHVSPETVPYSQCREVRTVSAAASNMDKITIAASAAICGTIVVAVLVFAAASRRRSRTVHRLHTQGPEKLPNPCCGGLTGTPSPSGPLSSLATLAAFGKQREWDQVSAYSSRSIPRARTFTEPTHPDPLPGRPGRARSLADGQSQHSYSQSGRYGGPGYPSSLLGSRTDLRQSRQSLGAASERASRLSLSGAAGGATGGTAGSRRRPRSRSRPASRYSVGSLGMGYCDTSDNWTDHDMDIYMARNPTTRGGLVPL